MNSEIFEGIKAALKGTKSNALPLSESEALRVVREAQEAFVLGNPRAWWMSLRFSPEIIPSEGRQLTEILPSLDKSFWFIPEIEIDALPVFDLTCSEIQTVLKECPFFEYYIVNKRMNWLVAESDHNEFYIVARIG